MAIVIIDAVRPAPQFFARQNPDGPDWLLIENGAIVARGLDEAHAKFFAQAGNEKHARAVNARTPIILGEASARWN